MHSSLISGDLIKNVLQAITDLNKANELPYHDTLYCIISGKMESPPKEEFYDTLKVLSDMQILEPDCVRTAKSGIIDVYYPGINFSSACKRMIGYAPPEAKC